MEQNKTIDKEIADVLLAISKVANRLAALFASGIKSKGVDKNVESNMNNLSQQIQEWNEHYKKIVEHLKDMDTIQREIVSMLGGLNENTEEPKLSLEQVRTVLAKLAQEGHQAEVRALITKYGATKLSDINPEHFKALLKEAEEI